MAGAVRLADPEVQEAGGIMSFFPLKRVVSALAGMVALFLAGMGPTMAPAQEVVPSTSASANSLNGDPAPRPVFIPSDVVDSEEPQTVPPVIPRPPAYIPATEVALGNDATMDADHRREADPYRRQGDMRRPFFAGIGLILGGSLLGVVFGWDDRMARKFTEAFGCP
jgi:hypothetical protein